MKNVLNVIRFEFRKLFYDKARLFLLLFTMLAVLLLVFLLTNSWIGNGMASSNERLEWTTEFENQIIANRGAAYNGYLEELAKESTQEGPYYARSADLLKLYKYYSFLLSTKTRDHFMGYTVSLSLLTEGAHNFNQRHLNCIRLLFSQDLVFMIMPFFALFMVFDVFYKDEIAHFDKNYLFYGIKKRQLILGKYLSSLLFSVLIMAFFMIPCLFLLK